MLSEKQFNRIKPYFPLSEGVDDLRVISGIIYVIRNGRTLPKATAPTRRSTIASCAGAGWVYSTAFFAELADKAGTPAQLMIDATHLKAHRTAASLLKKGMFPAISVAPRAA